MKHKIKILVFVLFPFSVMAQNITGIIYDAEATVKGAKIFNTTTKIKTYTDENGDFIIKASINDTLVFSSLFHEEKKIVLKLSDFETKMVIEIKKIVNNLDEVLLSEKTENKSFNDETYDTNLNSQIQNDIKNNPHLYSVTPKYGLDFIQIASLIGKLFKKKQTETSVVILATNKDLDSLFKNDTFFNSKLLKNDLKIKEEYKFLFFEYCEAQDINKKLLIRDNQFLLLDKLLEFSRNFLVFISDYEKKHIKD